jgi:hypothetical protein
LRTVGSHGVAVFVVLKVLFDSPAIVQHDLAVGGGVIDGVEIAVV